MNAARRQESVPGGEQLERIPSILLIDDEVLVRLALADYLRECGFKVYEAGNAGEAIEILEAGEPPIDLVFSDVRMPGEMDGFGLARWIQRRREGLAVILTSGDRKKTDAAKQLCENEPFFEKPYNLEAVLAEVRRIIDARSPRGGRGIPDSR